MALTLAYAVAYMFAARGRPEEERQVLRGEWLRAYLTRMGALWIKMGQIMAMRQDLLPRTMIAQLRPLQDDVPPMDERELGKVLAEAYGDRAGSPFRKFNPLPVASASVAQVHEAELQTGEGVAVKVIRRGVAKRLAQDLTLVGAAAKVLHYLVPSLRRLRIEARAEELEGLLLPQTDMLRESRIQSAIRANFLNHPWIRIPRVIEDLSTSSVLVMEFMDGIPGNESHRVALPAPQLARRLQDAVFTMLYLHGLSHADPHPGNVLFSPEGHIVLLDFGIIAELTEEEKWGLSSFYYACTRKEWAVAVDRYVRYLVSNPEVIRVRWEPFERKMTACLKEHFEARRRWSSIDFFKDVNRILTEHDACSKPSLMKIELTFMSCEGFVTQIDPEIDIWANARRFNDRFSPYMSGAIKETFDDRFAALVPGSLVLRKQAREFLVAPLHLDRYFFPSDYPLFVRRAYGSRIEDVDGNVYIDLSGGYGPHILGYAHPAITGALLEAAKTGFLNALANVPEMELARMLVEAFPAADKALLCNSGTEAVMQAIRLCRSHRRRQRVAKFEGHYHGFSDAGMVSSWFRLSGPEDRPEPIAGTQGCDPHIVENTLVLQYGHPRTLERLRDQAAEIACVICEPMPAALATYDEGFLLALRETCAELGIPLVFDEVVTGFRVAYGGVQTLTHIDPDLTCLGKIIGGGLPCGAVVGKKHLLDLARTTSDPFADYERRTFLGGTLSGNSLSCTAGRAMLLYLRDHPEIYEQLATQTRWLGSNLRDIAASHTVPLQVLATTSIFSLTFDHREARTYRQRYSGSNLKACLALAYYMRQRGVYVPELHTLMLSAAHTQADLETVLQAFDRSLEEMDADGFFEG